MGWIVVCRKVKDSTSRGWIIRGGGPFGNGMSEAAARAYARWARTPGFDCWAMESSEF